MPHPSPRPVLQDAAAYWDTYKPDKGEGIQPRPPADVFEWTQYPGHGPGAELLGDPATALDLGAAECAEAAFLARQRVTVTAVDLSPAQVKRARTWWHDLPCLEIVHADVISYLTEVDRTWNTVYSVWGAVWFTEPELLLPLIAKRLAPGGRLVFAQAEPTGISGPQQMRGHWLDDHPEATVLRWQYRPQEWTRLLRQAGFETMEARVVAAPESGKLGTLVVTAGVC